MTMVGGEDIDTEGRQERSPRVQRTRTTSSLTVCQTSFHVQVRYQDDALKQGPLAWWVKKWSRWGG